MSTCNDVIPGTFIMCGEGENYCSDECLERATMSDDKFKEMIKKFDAEEEERRKNPPPRPRPELKRGQVTVAELILQLQALPQDAPVETEGCDCYGEASGVELCDDGTVIVTRLSRWH